jgi:hypothetical protein
MTAQSLQFHLATVPFIRASPVLPLPAKHVTGTFPYRLLNQVRGDSIDCAKQSQELQSILEHIVCPTAQWIVMRFA